MLVPARRFLLGRGFVRLADSSALWTVKFNDALTGVDIGPTHRRGAWRRTPVSQDRAIQRHRQPIKQHPRRLTLVLCVATMAQSEGWAPGSGGGPCVY